MARFDGFIGPAYQAPSVVAGAEACVNLFAEHNDSPGAKAPFTYYKTPGLRSFATYGIGPFRGTFAQDGRAFGVSGDTLVEVSADGVTTSLGTLANDGLPVSICSNGQAGGQLFIVSGGYGYIFSLTTNTLTQIASAGFPSGTAAMGAFLDSYFLVLLKDGATWGVSDLEDGLTWDASDRAQKSITSDNLVSLHTIGRTVWLVGTQSIEPWYNTGDTFPFAPVPGAVIRDGSAAAWGLATISDVPFWIGSNVHGARRAYRANGYQAQRISTTGVEHAWSQYAVISDARAWSYELRGNSFYVVTFPSAGTTWQYNVTTGLWNELGRWVAARGAYEAHLGACHMTAFGKHLVGSRLDGTLYELTPEAYDDAGAPLRWLRRSPHVANGPGRVFHARVALDIEVGTTPVTDGQGDDPQVGLRWSDDGGHTWGPELLRSTGAQGAYTTRVEWHRLGSTRGPQGRVYELFGTDPVPVAISAAFLDAGGG
jgi:hypothetical protein